MFFGTVAAMMALEDHNSLDIIKKKKEISLKWM